MRASWTMLLDGLDSLGAAREVAPGEIEVSFTQGRVRRRVVVLMTAAEWDEMASVMWGDADDALADVKNTVRSMGADDRYAVYGDYQLEPSSTRVRQDPLEHDFDARDTSGGRWVAYPPEHDGGR